MPDTKLYFLGHDAHTDALLDLAAFFGDGFGVTVSAAGVSLKRDGKTVTFKAVLENHTLPGQSGMFVIPALSLSVVGEDEVGDG